MNRPIAFLTGLLLLVAPALGTGDQVSDPSTGVLRAPDGRVNLPEGYRQWVHIGTRYNPGGISILDGLPLKTPEVMNAYVEPSAMARFGQTGIWPDGSQIAKGMSATQSGADCDPTTHICARDTGHGIFETTLHGSWKDGERREAVPGRARSLGLFQFRA